MEKAVSNKKLTIKTSGVTETNKGGREAKRSKAERKIKQPKLDKDTFGQ